MGESVVSRNSLQLSVSFGKFENDSLSWEKWSSFSPNKYLEEVGNLSTPGSVAQKKAYFEAHYKKIAAQKLLELENSLETDPSSSDDNYQNIADQTNKASGTDTEISSLSTDNKSLIDVKIETNAKNVESSCKTSIDEFKEDESTGINCQNSVEATKEELNGKPEEIVLVEDETLQKEPQKLENLKEENSKMDAESICEKITSTKKEQHLAEIKKKKKPASTIAKLANNSTRKLSRPESKSTLISPSRSSAEKLSFSSLSRTENATAGKSTTLHISLNLDPSNSSDPPSLTMTRKSLFMEKMGDKDIVKRVFKTFQNDFSQLNDEYSSGHQQPLGHVAMKGIEQKVSTSTSLRKENERVRNIGEKMNAQRGLLATTWNSASSGSLNKAGLDGRKLKVSSSSIGSRSGEKTEKRNEFVKKVEEKSYAKATEKTRLSLKSKEEKEVEINRLRQSLNFKAKPMPDFYRSLKTSSERVGVKSGFCRRPQAA